MADIQPFTICFELSRSSKKSKNLCNGNQMINSNDSLNIHVKSEIIKYLRALANLEARQHIGDLQENEYLFSKQNPCFIIVRVAPPSNRRMDAPNWYPTVKALIDGLTDGGMFEDDNNDVITSFTFVPDKKTTNKKYRILLDIYHGHIGGLINA